MKDDNGDQALAKVNSPFQCRSYTKAPWVILLACPCAEQDVPKDITVKFCISDQTVWDCRENHADTDQGFVTHGSMLARWHSAIVSFDKGSKHLNICPGTCQMDLVHCSQLGHRIWFER